MDRITPAPRAVARPDAWTTAPAGRHGRCAPSDDDYVARLMGAIAAGDRSAVWKLRDVADPPVRRRLASTLHRLDVRYDADDLDGLVIDAVLAIADVAGAWRPGGAPPWVWANHRVVGVVHRFVGIFAKSLDALSEGDYGDAVARLTARGGCAEARSTAAVTAFEHGDDVLTPRAVLRGMASDRPEAALLDAALSEIVSGRDAALWLAVLDERAAGNRHPAVTVGARFGMRSDAVRKAVQRVGERLRRGTRNDRFAPLASLPVFAHDKRDAA